MFIHLYLCVMYLLLDQNVPKNQDSHKIFENVTLPVSPHIKTFCQILFYAESGTRDMLSTPNT